MRWEMNKRKICQQDAESNLKPGVSSVKLPFDRVLSAFATDQSDPLLSWYTVTLATLAGI